MNAALQQTIKHWGYVTPYAHVPRNEAEYERLLIFVEELMDWSRQKKDDRVTSLLQLAIWCITFGFLLSYSTPLKRSSTNVRKRAEEIF